MITENEWQEKRCFEVLKKKLNPNVNPTSMMFIFVTKMLQDSYFDVLCTLTLGKDVLDPEL